MILKQYPDNARECEDMKGSEEQCKGDIFDPEHSIKNQDTIIIKLSEPEQL